MVSPRSGTRFRRTLTRPTPSGSGPGEDSTVPCSFANARLARRAGGLSGIPGIPRGEFLAGEQVLPVLEAAALLGSVRVVAQVIAAGQVLQVVDGQLADAQV